MLPKVFTSIRLLLKEKENKKIVLARLRALRTFGSSSVQSHSVNSCRFLVWMCTSPGPVIWVTKPSPLSKVSFKPPNRGDFVAAGFAEADKVEVVHD